MIHAQPREGLTQGVSEFFQSCFQSVRRKGKRKERISGETECVDEEKEATRCSREERLR